MSNISLLLSLVLLSLMIEPIREIANTSVLIQSFLFHNFSNQSSTLPDSSLSARGQAKVHTNADQARSLF